MNHALSLAVCFALASASSYGYVVTGFGAGFYDHDTVAMDATLGITGYGIENFEDGTLQPWLSVEYTNTGLGAMTSLPLKCPDDACVLQTNPPYFRRDFRTHAWDGDYILYAPQPADIESALILRFLNGAISVGVALSDYTEGQTRTHAWAINGQMVGEVADIPHFSPNDVGRNMYVRIDAEAGDAPITSLTFFHSAAYDALEYDHVAFLAAPSTLVPEPGTLALLALGLAGLGFSRRNLLALRPNDVARKH